MWTGPDGESHRQKLAHDDRRKSAGQYRWPLGPLKLAAGDRVGYAIEALDNDAVDGPQKGSSRQQTLVVYSAAEHRREALRRATELWERLLAHLATRMEGPDRDGRKSEDKVRAQEPVDASGLALAGDIVSAARALARERDRNEALVSALQHVGQDVAARVRATSDSRRSGCACPAGARSWTWMAADPGGPGGDLRPGEGRPLPRVAARPAEAGGAPRAGRAAGAGAAGAGEAHRAVPEHARPGPGEDPPAGRAPSGSGWRS